VKAAASMLASDDLVLRPDDARALAGVIGDEVDRLRALISGVLDVERLRTRVLAPNTRPVKLCGIVATALSSLQARAKSVVVSVGSSLPLIQADPCLLERVIANLVGNALAVSPPEKVVHVLASAEDEHVRIAVVDHGPGIAIRDRERIFRPFERASPRCGGTGLGLAVVERFVDAMGGEISVADTTGGGATMFVALPAAI